MSVVNVTVANDGEVYKTSATTWTLCRDATSGSAVYAGYNYIGAAKGSYEQWRDFQSYTINIANLISVQSVVLYMYGSGDSSITNFNIYVCKGTQTGTPATGWFNDFTGWVSGGAHTPTYWSGAWNTSSYSATWNTITFNAAGIAAVQAANGGAALAICLLEDTWDIPNTTPPAVEQNYVAFKGSIDAGKEPYLAITYTAGISKSAIPLVEVEATGTRKLAKSVSSLVETESIGTRKLGKSITPLVEVENVGTRKLTKPLSVLVETESIGTLKLTKPLSTLVEMETSESHKMGLEKSIAVILEMETNMGITIPSWMRIKLKKIIDLATGEVNNPEKVNTMITEIVTRFNAMFETKTGHYHDGTDSKMVNSGLTGYTLRDISTMQLLGLFKRGGF